MGKQLILDVKYENPAIFHKIIKKQRGKAGACVNELHVESEVYRTDSEFLHTRLGFL